MWIAGKKDRRTMEIVVVAKMRIKNDARWLFMFMFITNRSKKENKDEKM